MSRSAEVQLKAKYATALKALIGRDLTKKDGIARARLAACEKRLNLKLPLALRLYYELAAALPINKERNVLYDPQHIAKQSGKLVFMEENQRVVFWGLRIEALRRSDPEVFQAQNSTPTVWYSEELTVSDFILKTWRWQRGLNS